MFNQFPNLNLFFLTPIPILILLSRSYFFDFFFKFPPGVGTGSTDVVTGHYSIMVNTCHFGPKNYESRFLFQRHMKKLHDYSRNETNTNN